jgi:hypothetical protein
MGTSGPSQIMALTQFTLDGFKSIQDKLSVLNPKFKEHWDNLEKM